MNVAGPPVRWLVQRPPVGDDSPTHALLEQACATLSLPFESIDVTPGGAVALPPYDGPVIVHGRNTLLQAALHDHNYRRSVFFDPTTFTPEASSRAWGARTLNAKQEIKTWAELADTFVSGTGFIRPNDDAKLFTGRVFTPSEFCALYAALKERNRILPTDRLVHAPVQEIDAEARVFLVEGRAVGGSFYRPNDHRLPQDVIDFAEEAARVWSPAPVFVLDVARVDQTYRIIETNCMNGSRFYGSDVAEIVKKVTQYQRLQG